MLSKHTQLLEFLEIPQIMETCLRNNSYDEALKLDSYVRRLSKKHGNSILLVEVKFTLICIFNSSSNSLTVFTACE